MSVVLYRFDDVEKYTILESKTTVRGPVAMHVEPPSAGEGQACLRITVAQQPAELAEPALVLALPVRALDGVPKHFLLAVCGDASGGRIRLEAADATGVSLVYAFGTLHFSGWRVCMADPTQPSNHSDGRHHEPVPVVTPPLHFHRLGFVLSDPETGIDIRLRTLGASGNVRLAAPGLA